MPGWLHRACSGDVDIIVRATRGQNLWGRAGPYVCLQSPRPTDSDVCCMYMRSDGSSLSLCVDTNGVFTTLHHQCAQMTTQK